MQQNLKQKHPTGVNTSEFAKKFNLSSLKS